MTDDRACSLTVCLHQLNDNQVLEEDHASWSNSVNYLVY
jgi:hypothetical protein